MVKEYFVFFKDLVTQAKDGIMRKEDKKKLDGIDEGANKIIIDSALSKTSQNPVQNKVIAGEIEELKKSGSDGKKNVANAITGMGVTTATDADFVTITQNITKIGENANISAGDVLSGKVAYARGQYIIGNMPNNGAKTAALDCGEYYSIPAGYHNGAGRVSANSLASQTGATAAASDILSGKTAYVNGSKIIGNIPSKAAAIYTPGTTNQEIAAGQYLSGKQTIKGDANLAAGKIKKGVSIFGVAGSFTEDANAEAGDILNEKTAYVNGNKVTGNIPSKAAATYTPSTQDQEIAAGQYLSGKQTIKGDANLLAANIKKGVSIFGVNGNLEANSLQSRLGAGLLKFFKLIRNNIYLYDYYNGLTSNMKQYARWYSCSDFEQYYSYGTGNVEDGGGYQILPGDSYTSVTGKTTYPKITYIVFETGHCLVLYLRNNTRTYEWISGEPSAFSVKVLWAEADYSNPYLRRTYKDIDAGNVSNFSYIFTNIILSDDISYYIIPIAYDAMAGPSYVAP